jgi:hypothetical protein
MTQGLAGKGVGLGLGVGGVGAAGVGAVMLLEHFTSLQAVHLHPEGV